MTTVVLIAGLLLIERMITASFLLAVIIKQVRQLRRTASKYNALRVTLMILTAVVFVGQFVPMLFDASVIVSEWGSPDVPDGLVIAYTLTNATTALLVSILLWVIYYRQAASK